MQGPGFGEKASIGGGMVGRRRRSDLSKFAFNFLDVSQNNAT